MSKIQADLAAAPLETLCHGPGELSRAFRLERVEEVRDRLERNLGDSLVALGLYGSLARGEDGPFSDIELMGVVDEGEEHRVWEWVQQGVKLKLHLYRRTALEAEARAVDAEWSLNLGRYHFLRPLVSREPVFAQAVQWCRAASQADRQAAMRGLLLSEVYEFSGKARNQARRSGRSLGLPALRLAEAGALLLGLQAGVPFTTRHAMLEEASGLPTSPEAFRLLCRRLQGDLEASPLSVAELDAAAHALWTWALTRVEGLEACLSIPEVLR